MSWISYELHTYSHMSNLSFVFGDPNNPEVLKCDFFLSYDKQWNNRGDYYWYHLYALPSITKTDKLIRLGRIWISESRPRSSSFVIYPKSPDPRIEDRDILCRMMGYDTPFERIPARFMSLVGDDIAKSLFVLLNPSQRKSFIDALHLCVSEDDYERGRKERTLPSGMLRQYEKWSDAEKGWPISKYLLSEIDYSELPGLSELANSR